jgi:hypothetical protein
MESNWSMVMLVAPCHHGIVHPLVVDGEDTLQILGVASNISSHRQATSSGPPA